MMRILLALMIAMAPAVASACEGVGVVQSFAVATVPQVQIQTVVPQVAVQTFAPVAVQAVAVQSFAVPQVAVVQNVGHCGVVANGLAVVKQQVVRTRARIQNLRPLRSRTVIRQSIR